MDETTVANGSRMRLPVRFRWARPDELDQVMAIDAATWPRPLSESAWHKALVADGVTCAVAVHDGRVVGYAAYKVFDEFIHLYKIAVAPRHQRRGVASALLVRLKRTLRRSGRGHIQLRVGWSNAAARMLYSRHGFVRSDVEADYYGPGEDACVLIYDREEA